MKQRIALDVESVLANILDPFFEQYNSKHGTNYTREDMEDWDWIPRELDIQEFLSMTEEEWKRRAFDGLPPEEQGLRATVKQLSRQYPVDIVTEVRRRNPMALAKTAILTAVVTAVIG